jgi:hypothetical protein
MSSALDGGGWSTSRPGRLYPREIPVPIVQEAGWAPGPVWTGAENLTLTGIRSPDRPGRIESLYRLSYPSLQEEEAVEIFGGVEKWFFGTGRTAVHAVVCRPLFYVLPLLLIGHQNSMLVDTLSRRYIVSKNANFHLPSFEPWFILFIHVV